MKWLLAGLVLLPVTAGAAPVYLKCQNDGAKQGFDVTVDEAQGRVVQSGYKPFEQAHFTAKEITYEYVDRGPAFSTRESFSIDRTTLAFKMVWAIGESRGSSKEVESTGKCEVVKPGQRKI